MCKDTGEGLSVQEAIDLLYSDELNIDDNVERMTW